MNAKKTIWDPLRKKDVTLTPEESVRQWFIKVLNENFSVPLHLMTSEAEMKFGRAGKLFRADILIYDRSAHPLALVECKRPDIDLTREVLDQALKYNMVLNVSHIFITNGKNIFAFRKNSEGFGPIDKIPDYEEMVCRQ